MVTARRSRRRVKTAPDRTVSRSRQRVLLTVSRSYRGATLTARRSKGCVFEMGACRPPPWQVQDLAASAVRTALEALQRAGVEIRMPVERHPGHGVPAGAVRALAFDGLEDEAGFHQLTLGPGDDIPTPPAPRLEVAGRRQQPAIVVPDQLPGDLQQQRPGRMAQACVGWAIQHGPGKRHEAAGIAAGVDPPELVATVGHGLPLQMKAQPLAQALGGFLFVATGAHEDRGNRPKPSSNTTHLQELRQIVIVARQEGWQQPRQRVDFPCGLKTDLDAALIHHWAVIRRWLPRCFGGVAFCRGTHAPALPPLALACFLCWARNPASRATLVSAPSTPT